MENLGAALWYQGRYAEAEQEYRQLLDVERRVSGTRSPSNSDSDGQSGIGHPGAGSPGRSRADVSRSCGHRAACAGARTPGPPRWYDGLANSCSSEGRLAEAEKLYREALGIRLRTLGPEHRETLESQVHLVETCFSRKAISTKRKNCNGKRWRLRFASSDRKNRDTLESQANLAGILIREGHYAEAEKIARQTFEVQLRSLGPQHPQIRWILCSNSGWRWPTAIATPRPASCFAT